jgi:hypothetical protein
MMPWKTASGFGSPLQCEAQQQQQQQSTCAGSGNDDHLCYGDDAQHWVDKQRRPLPFAGQQMAHNNQ